MKLNKLLLMAFAGSALFVSCNDDEAFVDAPQGAYDDGVLVLNEGNFNVGNASVSYLSNDLVVENNIFATNNPNRVLGDTAQDIGLVDDLAYIVLNNSNKIEVVNRYTFAHVATISGLVNPRYIAFSNGRAYVTNWGDGTDANDDYIAVINLSTNAVTGTIPVAEGPERIIEEDGKLYIAQKGGYNYGNTITVVNAATNTVTATINVGDVPGTLEEEDGLLYVLNEGRPSYSGSETSGSLSIINLATNTVTGTRNFTDVTHPDNLVIEDDNMYYTIEADVFVAPLTATTFPTTPLLTTTPQLVYGIYSFAVHNDRIYIGDAGNYSSNGTVRIFTLNGTIEGTFEVGVIPSGFYFND